MPGKRSRPVIDKLAGVLRSGIIDTITSPRSLLDSRALRSSSGLKSYYCDQQEGIGLGIVVALDNKARNCHVKCGGEILAKYAICNQIANRSIPINVDSISKNTIDKSTKEQDIIIDGFEEEFTYVTCHGPNKSTTTRVYYSGGEFDNHQQPSLKAKLSKQIGVFNISSPVRFSDDLLRGSDSDFLSSCYLCRKGLQGKDIYMYRGEKAFCSEECRQGQIRMDERKEQCRSEASRSSEVSSSPYSCTSRGQIFSTGIVAV